MTIAATMRASRRNPEVRSYDFRAPEGLDRARLRLMTKPFDRFVRLAGSVMTGALRMPIQIKVANIRQAPWDDFARGVVPPAHLIVFTLSPLPGRAILHIPLDFAMAMVDVRLSGAGDGWYPNRQLTEIEEILLAPIVDSLLNELYNALGQYLEVEPVITQKVADTDLLQAVITSGSCVVVEFEVHFGESGLFNVAFCLPIPAARPIVEAVEKSELALADESDEPDPAMHAQILRTPVDVTVRFSPARLSPPEIADLAVGDVIPLHHPPNKPLMMFLGGAPRHQVLPTASGRHLAAVVVDPAAVPEDIEEVLFDDAALAAIHDDEDEPPSGQDFDGDDPRSGQDFAEDEPPSAQDFDLEARRRAAEQLFKKEGSR